MPAASARASRWAGVRAAAGGALRAAVVDDLDGEPVARQQRPPGGEQVAGPLAAPGEHRPADVGVGAEQHQQPARLGAPSLALLRHVGRSRRVNGRPRCRVRSHFVRGAYGFGGSRAARTVRKSHGVGVARGGTRWRAGRGW